MMQQCSAEEVRPSGIDYCIREKGHGRLPHRCYLGHEWTDKPTADPARTQEAAASAAAEGE